MYVCMCAVLNFEIEKDFFFSRVYKIFQSKDVLNGIISNFLRVTSTVTTMDMLESLTVNSK